MAALPNEVKAFIVQSLACFETPTKIAELVKEEFSLVVTRQQISAYDPANAMAKSLSAKWVDLFASTRERFQTEISDIPIANKSYRLRVLNRMMTAAEKMKNLSLTAQLMEQAAKEVGEAYTNKQKLEHSGPNGGVIQTATLNLKEFEEIARKLNEEV